MVQNKNYYYFKLLAETAAQSATHAPKYTYLELRQIVQVPKSVQFWQLFVVLKQAWNLFLFLVVNL